MDQRMLYQANYVRFPFSYAQQIYIDAPTALLPSIPRIVVNGTNIPAAAPPQNRKQPPQLTSSLAHHHQHLPIGGSRHVTLNPVISTSDDVVAGKSATKSHLNSTIEQKRRHSNITKSDSSRQTGASSGAFQQHTNADNNIRPTSVNNATKRTSLLSPFKSFKKIFSSSNSEKTIRATTDNGLAGADGDGSRRRSRSKRKRSASAEASGSNNIGEQQRTLTTLQNGVENGDGFSSANAVESNSKKTAPPAMSFKQKFQYFFASERDRRKRRRNIASTADDSVIVVDDNAGEQLAGRPRRKVISKKPSARRDSARSLLSSQQQDKAITDLKDEKAAKLAEKRDETVSKKQAKLDKKQQAAQAKLHKKAEKSSDSKTDKKKKSVSKEEDAKQKDDQKKSGRRSSTTSKIGKKKKKSKNGSTTGSDINLRKTSTTSTTSTSADDQDPASWIYPVLTQLEIDQLRDMNAELFAFCLPESQNREPSPEFLAQLAAVQEERREAAKLQAQQEAEERGEDVEAAQQQNDDEAAEQQRDENDDDSDNRKDDDDEQDDLLAQWEASQQIELENNVAVQKELISAVKRVPWNLYRKLKLLRLSKAYVERYEGQLSRGSAAADDFARRWKYFKRLVVNLLAFFVPWNSRIKEVESRFGSVVSGYFIFTRWMFWLNLFLLLAMLGCVAIPEYIVTSVRGKLPDGRWATNALKIRKENEKDLRLNDLLSLSGSIIISPFYYGYYSQAEDWLENYNIPISYFAVYLLLLGVSLYLILQRMAQNTKNEQLSDSSEQYTFSWRMFVSWDYLIANADSADNKIAAIQTSFKEAISEVKELEQEMNFWVTWARRMISHALWLGVLVLVVYSQQLAASINRNAEARARNGGKPVQIYEQYLNNILTMFWPAAGPVIFEQIERIDAYHPRTKAQVTLFRLVTLIGISVYGFVSGGLIKISIAASNNTRLEPFLAPAFRRNATLIGHKNRIPLSLLSPLDGDGHNNSNAHSPLEYVFRKEKPEHGSENEHERLEQYETACNGCRLEKYVENIFELRELCWENDFGKELIEQVYLDSLKTIAITLITDLVRAVFVRYAHAIWFWDLESTFPGYAEFKTGDAILEHIQVQFFTWIGAFFAPGILVIGVVRLVVLIYFKSWLTNVSNVPSESVFRAGSDNFYYIILLGALFIVTLIMGWLVVIIPPSFHCGPFSEYARIYDILADRLTHAVQANLVTNTTHGGSLTTTTTTTRAPPRERGEADDKPLVIGTERIYEYIIGPGFIIPIIVLLMLIIWYLMTSRGVLDRVNRDLKRELEVERTEGKRKIFAIAGNVAAQQATSGGMASRQTTTAHQKRPSMADIFRDFMPTEEPHSLGNLSEQFSPSNAVIGRRASAHRKSLLIGGLFSFETKQRKTMSSNDVKQVAQEILDIFGQIQLDTPEVTVNFIDEETVVKQKLDNDGENGKAKNNKKRPSATRHDELARMEEEYGGVETAEAGSSANEVERRRKVKQSSKSPSVASAAATAGKKRGKTSKGSSTKGKRHADIHDEQPTKAGSNRDGGSKSSIKRRPITIAAVEEKRGRKRIAAVDKTSKRNI